MTTLKPQVMKALAILVLVGASSAASPFQHVLQTPAQEPDSHAKHLNNLQESFKSLTGQVRAAWDDVSNLFPEAMKQATLLSLPKGHTRRPATHWDHIIKGAELPSLWVEKEGGSQGDDQKGYLDEYNLRSKKTHPGALGVDPGVTQYSGYLDDEENDKHLFYCEGFQSE